MPTGAPSPTLPSVLHVAAVLLQPTETFIQQRLAGEQFKPMAMAWGRAPGGLPIPCPAVFLHARPPAGRFSLRRLGRGVVREFLARLELRETLRRLRPSVVHAHFGPVGAAVEPSCRALGIPLVVSFYGFDTKPTHALLYERLFTYASAVTAEGPALAQRLKELGARNDSVAVLPLALPDWAQRAEPRPPPPPAPLKLLQVARLTPKKGVFTTLRAIAHARKAGSDVEVTIAGDGELMGDARAMAIRLGIANAVSFLGFVSYDLLPDLFEQAHAIIQPSETAADGDTEGGAPTVLIEAQACGLPILGTFHADIPAVVADGETGLLSPECDHVALADNIIRIASDRDLLERLSAAARPSVLARHSRHSLLHSQEAIYRQASGMP